MNRADRRAAAKDQRRGRAHLARVKQRPHSIDAQRLRTQVLEDVAKLQTSAGLQAWAGGNEVALRNEVGRLVFITCYAIGHQGDISTDDLDVRIVRGTAEALGDLSAMPQTLELQRGAIQSGLQAIGRLVPRLDPLLLMAGAAELDCLLDCAQGMGTAQAQAALEGRHG